jgi:hypothetical protein
MQVLNCFLLALVSLERSYIRLQLGFGHKTGA